MKNSVSKTGNLSSTTSVDASLYVIQKLQMLDEPLIEFITQRICAMLDLKIEKFCEFWLRTDACSIIEKFAGSVNILNDDIFCFLVSYGAKESVKVALRHVINPDVVIEAGTRLGRFLLKLENISPELLACVLELLDKNSYNEDGIINNFEKALRIIHEKNEKDESDENTVTLKYRLFEQKLPVLKFHRNALEGNIGDYVLLVSRQTFGDISPRFPIESQITFGHLPLTHLNSLLKALVNDVPFNADLNHPEINLTDVLSKLKLVQSRTEFLFILLTKVLNYVPESNDLVDRLTTTAYLFEKTLNIADTWMSEIMNNSDNSPMNQRLASLVSVAHKQYSKQMDNLEILRKVKLVASSKDAVRLSKSFLSLFLDAIVLSDTVFGYDVSQTRLMFTYFFSLLIDRPKVATPFLLMVDALKNWTRVKIGKIQAAKWMDALMLCKGRIYTENRIVPISNAIDDIFYRQEIAVLDVQQQILTLLIRNRHVLELNSEWAQHVVEYRKHDTPLAVIMELYRIFDKKIAQSNEQLKEWKLLRRETKEALSLMNASFNDWVIFKCESKYPI
ncbi:hypothetical protein ACOME3_002141 [Neoechinorhynchus agilis]